MTFPDLFPKSIFPGIHQPLPFFRNQPGVTRKAPKSSIKVRHWSAIIHGKYLFAGTFTLVSPATPHCHCFLAANEGQQRPCLTQNSSCSIDQVCLANSEHALPSVESWKGKTVLRIIATKAAT
jgi:hypothetical protein